MKKTLTKRLTSLLLCVALLLGLVPASLVNAAAGDTGAISTVSSAKIADPHNLHGWKDFFGPNYLNTENSGGVWSDKSVFASMEDFKNAMAQGENVKPNAAYNNMTIKEDNFLVALSAIAATKEIVGYSALPTDTVFILDVSQSMDNSRYVPTMVSAANDAIDALLNLNKHNRVGVVLYSGNSDTGDPADLSDAKVLLPLDRYTAGLGNAYLDYTGAANATGVTVANGVQNSAGGRVTGSKTTAGGTYIQSGLYLALGEFEKAYENGTTIIESDLIQGGAKRIPVISLMSDGQPTIATDQYSTFTRGQNGTTNHGDGSANTNTITFLTQLTAKYVREQVTDWYDNEALFYSLWLKNASDTSTNATLDPASSNATLDGWWRSYLNATAGSDISFRVGDYGTFRVKRDSVVDRVPAVNPATEEYNESWQKEQNYVNKAFDATNANDFEKAFEAIVETIVAQSRYYPTMVEGQDHESSGYITIEDPIGAFMLVDELEGIDIGGHLFTGEQLIRMMIDSQFGNRETYTENGWKLIRSIQERIGVSESVAIALAEDAWEYGQLGYNAVTGKYSNYIGWYADDNNEFVAFWHEGHTREDVPAGATQVMKSFGFYGTVDEAISDSNIEGTDMMHVSVRIATRLSDGDQTVSFGIPAALIPLVLYQVEVNSNKIATATEAKLSVSGATHPIRLLMEVGLRDDINELTVAEIVKKSDHYHVDHDGSFVFYTNRWGDIDVNTGSMTLPDSLDHTSTVSHYNPSAMNELYYFHQDTVIYSDAQGTEYTGDAKPSGNGFYELVYIFASQANGGAAEIRKVYRPISTKAISHAEKNTADNGWHIPGNVAHHNITSIKVDKKQNLTGTLPYIAKIDIPGYDQGKYEVFEQHGNNGRLVLAQATGLELTKVVPVVIPGTSTEDFVLNVAFTAPAGTVLPETVKVSYDKKTYTEMATSAVKVTLDANQKAWIYGLPAGTSFTVTEEDHADYQPSLASVTGTLPEGVITPVSFTNRAKDAGRVVVSKTVEHPFGEVSVPATVKFDFVATLTDGTSPLASTPVETSKGMMTTTANGEISFTLVDGESISFNGLPNGTVITVKEIDLPAGFAPKADTLSAQVEYGTVKELPFENTYTPAPVKGEEVKILGTKLLDGRQWQDFDAYRFQLQYWNGATWQTLAGAANNTATKDSPTFSLSDVMASFSFDHEGSYRFWIVEEEGDLGGITYDQAVREFTVEVEDNWNGSFEIRSVNATARTGVTSVTANGVTTWTVETEFTNRYGTGTTFIDLAGNKTLMGDNLSSYVGENGFGFQLWSATKAPDGSLQQGILLYTAKLDELGNYKFDHNYIGHLVFDRADTYYFIVREAENLQNPLLVYDETYYEIQVEVTDNLLGGLVPETTVTKVKGSERTTVSAGALDFTNEMRPEPIFVTIPGRKTYNLPLNGNNFTFDLYRATRSGSVYTPEGSALLSASNVAGGAFTLQDAGTEYLKFTKAGEYHFAVKERVPQGVTSSDPTLNGVTYDTTLYGITIRVSETLNGQGRNTLSYEILVNGSAGGSLNFTNSYDVSAQAGVAIGGEKELDGKTAGTENFTFRLYSATVQGGNVSLGALLDETTPVNGLFSFAEIRFDSLSDVGDHYYVVKEKLPQGAQAGVYKGVTYDTREYLVKLSVTDNGDGTLKVEKSVTLNGAPAEIKFENTYGITSETQVVIGGEKEAKFFNMKDGDFTFQIFHGILDGSGKVTATGNAFDTKTNASGKFTFDSISYRSLSDLGDHYYVVKEALPVEAGGNSTYLGIAYDRSEFVVKVTVTDNGDGTLKAEKSITKNGAPADIKFENTYGITLPAGITIGGEKKLDRKTLTDHLFTFELYRAQVDGNGKVTTVGTVLDSDTNKNGTFSFDTIEFKSLDDVGQHLYAVKEVIPQEADANGVYKGVKYDTRIYLVTVNVADNGDGTLKVTSSVTVENRAASLIEFHNKYGTMTPFELKLNAAKTMDGKAAENGKFSFALYTATKDSGKLVAGQTPLQTVSSVDGKIVFDAARFDQLDHVGTYYFAMKEVIPEGVDENLILNEVQYDPTLYYAVVTVSDNGDGTFKVEVQYTDEAGKSVQEVTWANKTAKKQEEHPPTGDRTNLALYVALLFVSGVTLFAIPLRAKKRKA